MVHAGRVETTPRTTTAMVRADSVEPTNMAELKDFARIAAAWRSAAIEEGRGDHARDLRRAS
jgi:hypothetical protein